MSLLTDFMVSKNASIEVKFSSTRWWQ